jgi:hypothetical protein
LEPGIGAANFSFFVMSDVILERIKEFLFFFGSNLALSSNKERLSKAKADTVGATGM